MIERGGVAQTVSLSLATLSLSLSRAETDPFGPLLVLLNFDEAVNHITTKSRLHVDKVKRIIKHGVEKVSF
jgi:hypothetical protein